MSKKPLDIVRTGLQVYADRGVFRGLDEVRTRNGKQSFTFVWFGDRLLRLDVDTQKAVLTFRHLLPNVPLSSELYSELRAFLSARCSLDLPKHRRIDAKRADVVCINRASSVSIALKIKNKRYSYGLNRIVNLVHEIFVQLNDAHPDYMCENFDMPQE